MEQQKNDKLDTVFFPRLGMNYICESMTDVIEYKMSGKERIDLYVCAQTNSYPHMGTLVNFMIAFSLAEKYEKHFGVPVTITADLLDNTKGEIMTVNDIRYFKSMTDTYIDGVGDPLSEMYMVYFRQLLDKLKSMYSRDYSIRTYSEFQSIKEVRGNLVRVFKDEEYFAELFNPVQKKIRIRFPCPYCKYIEERAEKLNVTVQDNGILLEDTCFAHGKINTFISADNDAYFDSNVPLRNIVRGAYFIDKDRKENCLSVIVEGADWAGLWPVRIYAEGLMRLGYNEMPNFIFTPQILDWAGTKLSKRMYVGNSAYRKMYKNGLINISSLEKDFGSDVYQKLYDEINKWVDEPKRFFRDYTVEYFEQILS